MNIPWSQPFEYGDVRTFLNDFEDVVELASGRTDRGKLTTLGALLKGWVQTILFTAQKGSWMTDWAAAEGTLFTGFDIPAHSQETMHQIKSACLRFGVDPLAHVVLLRKLLARQFPKPDPMIRTQVLMDCFANSLLRPLRKKFLTARFGQSLDLLKLLETAWQLQNGSTVATNVRPQSYQE